jgi:hypothetical protein
VNGWKPEGKQHTQPVNVTMPGDPEPGGNPFLDQHLAEWDTDTRPRAKPEAKDWICSQCGQPGSDHRLGMCHPPEPKTSGERL